jgi:single-strand DNA-binding protein
MAGINKVILVGNVGGDPEMRFVPSGSAVANFTLATSIDWKDKQTGERKEKTEWHRIVAWDKLGEFCGNYLKKGSLIYVDGKIQTRSYEDKEGVKRYITEIIASTIQFVGGKGSVAPDSARSEGDTSRGTSDPGKTGSIQENDDIPF